MLTHLVDRMGKSDTALGRFAEFLEAPLAAAAGVDLRLDDPERPGKLLRSFDGFLDTHRRIASGNRDAVLREQFLGLIFVDVHGAALKQIEARNGRRASRHLA